MAYLLVADGGDGLQVWRAAENVLNKPSRTGTVTGRKLARHKMS